MKHIISLGAGVQSSTMALMAARGELGYPVDAAVFADTQNEPKAVYEWLLWLKSNLGFPVYEVTAGDLWKENMRPRVSKKNGKTYYKHFVPTFSINPDGASGMLPRKCTHDFKLVPIYKFLRRFAGVQRGQKTLAVKSLIGISLDEVQRMKPAKFPWAENVYPLIEKRITRAGCLKWLKDRGYPEPPKSACTFCPYHNKSMWMAMKKDHPEEFAQAVRFERELNALSAAQEIRGVEFLHASRVPLDQVDFRTDAEKGQGDLFTNECEGMCGV